MNTPKNWQYHKKRYQNFLKVGGAHAEFLKEYPGTAMSAMAQKFYPQFVKDPVRICHHDLFFYGWIQHRTPRMLDMVEFIEPWRNRKSGVTGAAFLNEFTVKRDGTTAEDVTLLEEKGMQFQETETYLALKNLEALGGCGN